MSETTLENIEITQESSNVVDAKLFKKAKKLNKDNKINDIIGKLANLHKTMDDGLKEISELCCKENKNDR